MDEITRSFGEAVAALPAHLRARASDRNSACLLPSRRWQLRDGDGVLLNPPPAPVKSAAPRPARRQHAMPAEAVGKAIGTVLRESLSPINERLDRIEERGIRFRGKYQGADRYGPGDVVSFDESLWSCTKETEGGDRPSSSSDFWTLMLRGR